MAAVFSATDVITWAKISQYLGRKYLTQNMLLQGGDVDPTYPVFIRGERRALEFMNSFDPSNATIDQVTNYVYSITKYKAQAKVIAGQGGTGGIVIPGTGVAATIRDISIEFELGVTSSPVVVNGVNVALPSDGDDSITIPLENIMNGSLLLTIGGVPQPTIATTNSTYTTIAYSTTQAVITLGPVGFTFSNTNTYMISGLQFVAL